MKSMHLKCECDQPKAVKYVKIFTSLEIKLHVCL